MLRFDVNVTCRTASENDTGPVQLELTRAGLAFGSHDARIGIDGSQQSLT